MGPEIPAMAVAQFQKEALPVIEKLARHFGIQEPAAVEAYGQMLSLAVAGAEYNHLLASSMEVLSFEACIAFVKIMRTKKVDLLTYEEGRIGLCLGLLKVKQKPFMSQRIGRNEQCPCGSGAKFKFCCLAKGHKYVQS